MSTEHEAQQSPPGSAPPIDPVQPPQETILQQPLPPQKTKSVVFYIIVMFSVALFLIILSFFMQQRNHEALLEGLSTSASSVQSIVDLELEKNELKKSHAALEAQLAEAKNTEKTLTDAATRAEDSVRALEYLTEARLLYFSGKHKEAKAMLTSLQENELFALLPTKSSLEGTPSPRERYDELAALLA